MSLVFLSKLFLSRLLSLRGLPSSFLFSLELCLRRRLLSLLSSLLRDLLRLRLLLLLDRLRLRLLDLDLDLLELLCLLSRLRLLDLLLECLLDGRGLLETDLVRLGGSSFCFGDGSSFSLSSLSGLSLCSSACLFLNFSSNLLRISSSFFLSSGPKILSIVSFSVFFSIGFSLVASGFVMLEVSAFSVFSSAVGRVAALELSLVISSSTASTFLWLSFGSALASSSDTGEHDLDLARFFFFFFSFLAFFFFFLSSSSRSSFDSLSSLRCFLDFLDFFDFLDEDGGDLDLLSSPELDRLSLLFDEEIYNLRNFFMKMNTRMCQAKLGFSFILC